MEQYAPSYELMELEQRRQDARVWREIYKHFIHNSEGLPRRARELIEQKLWYSERAIVEADMAFYDRITKEQEMRLTRPPSEPDEEVFWELLVQKCPKGSAVDCWAELPSGHTIYKDFQPDQHGFIKPQWCVQGFETDCYIDFEDFKTSEAVEMFWESIAAEQEGQEIAAELNKQVPAVKSLRHMFAAATKNPEAEQEATVTAPNRPRL